MNEIITVPIRFAGSTMLVENNCFSLYDIEGNTHKVVNFYYENLKRCISKSNQIDIKIRCIPKSTKIWEICDDRIPPDYYSSEYCVVCTPLRMLPLEQRKRELSKFHYKKIYDKTNNTSWVLSKSKEKISRGGIIIPN